VDGDITKFEYDAQGVLDQIIKPNADELDFNFDLLGRLRDYDTDSRESTFNYDGTKRFGDFDDGWKRYHWCNGEFLGYEDDTNTYYIVPDREGSTKIIIDSSQGVVNRIEYDHLGKIRSQTAAPQVELLWRGRFFNDDIEVYFSKRTIYLTIGSTWDIRKALTGMIIYFPNLLNPLSLCRLPILEKHSLSFNRIPRGSDIINPGGGNDSSPLLTTTGISISGGSQGGWNADSTEYYISPYMWYGHHLCCYAYEVDGDFMPTGRCSVWGDCTDGLY
jgi:hypothetical protein